MTSVTEERIMEERRRRFLLILAAYAYEIENDSIIPDHEFDMECRKVDLSIETGRMDDWWRANFNPSTGMWIHRHPDLAGVERSYREWKARRN